VLEKTNASPGGTNCAGGHDAGSKDYLCQPAECWNGRFEEGLEFEETEGADEDCEIAYDARKRLDEESEICSRT